MADVFISYSRKDKTFMTRLHSALVERGRDVWVDFEDIPVTADWQREIYSGIESADAFIFIISPNSRASPVCNLEIAHAIEHGKRIIPIVYVEADEKTALTALEHAYIDENVREALAGRDLMTLAHDNWRYISRQNWLFFDVQANFDAALNQLISTLDTDLSYVREHTRLLIQARQWENAQQDSDLLLRGAQLVAAETWLASAGQKDPRPTELHSALIMTSRQAAVGRQRRLLAALMGGFIAAIVISIYALIQTQIAQSALTTANLRGTEAAQRAVEAQDARATSDANLRDAWSIQSRFLADLSRQQLSAGYVHTALLLALESLRHYPDVYNPASGQVLSDALTYPAYETANLAHQGVVWGVRMNRAETRLLSWSQDHTAQVWDVATRQPLYIMRHDDELVNAVWNPQETRILTWGLDDTVRAWDAENGAALGVYDGSESRIGGVVWHPDGIQVAIWGDDSTVRIWDAQTGEILHELTHNDLRGAAWHPDGTYLLSWSGRERDVRIWQPDIERAILLLPHGGAVNGAVWSADGTRILTWADDLQTRVWDAVAGKVHFAMPNGDDVLDARWSPDESQILTRTSHIRLWDGKNGRFQTSLQTDDGYVEGAIWSPDGKRVLTWGSGRVYLWDARPGISREPLLRLEHPDGVIGAIFNAQGTQILSWSSTFDAGTVRVWDAANGILRLRLPYDMAIVGANWDRVGSRLLTWTGSLEGGAIRMWVTRPGAAQQTFNLSGQVNWLTTTVRGLLGTVFGDYTQIIWGKTRAAVIGTDNRVRLWERSPETGLNLLAELPPQPGLRGAAWSHDEQQLVTWANALTGSSVILWNNAGGESRVLPFELSDGAVNGVRWNADNSRLMTWTENGALKIWDTQTGETLHLLQHQQPVRGAVWSADETRLLTRTSASFTGIGGQVRVWDVESKQVQISLPHDWVLIGAVWDASETRILTWSYDAFSFGLPSSKLQLWDGQNGLLLRTLQQPNQVTWAAWGGGSPETHVISWSADQTLRTWVIDINTLIAIGQSQIVRPFTEAQRQQFFLTSE